MMLKPGQRTTLAKEISARLASEEWAIIDLTLQNFSLPTEDQWQGSKLQYIIEHVKQADDEILVDLAKHLSFEIEHEEKSRIEPAFWQKDMFRLFISHLSSEKKFVAEVQEALLGFGISGFVAHEDIEPNTEWQSQIETALATCDALVAFLHPGFHESLWTDQEIGFAMGRGVPVFAVGVGAVPYGFIGKFQAFKGANRTPLQLARDLFDGYRRNKRSQAKIASVIVGLFEESHSFAAATTRIKYLEELEYWEPAFSRRIKMAAKVNGQISGAWGVQAQVDRLVASRS